MDKSPDAFRTISEAAGELGLPQHVLRFWETRFSQIKPLKRGGGRRYYRPGDVTLLKGIQELLYGQGFTIKGVQRILKDQGVRAVIAIGETGQVEPVTPAGTGHEDVAARVLASPAPDSAVAPPAPDLDKSGLGKTAGDKLTKVLRELLACKRALDSAREG